MSSVGVMLDQAWRAMVDFFGVQGFPRGEILSMLVILVVGIIGGRMVSEVVRRLLKKTPMDDMAVKSGAQRILRKLDYAGTLSDLIGDLVHLFVYLVVAFVLFQMLGLEFLLSYLQSAVSFLPRLVLALLVLIGGFVLSSHVEHIVARFFRTAALSGPIDDSGASIPVYRILGKFLRFTVYVASILASLIVIGVNIGVINILIGVFALGLVTMFVLGVRDIVKNVVASIYFQLSDTFASGDHLEVGGYEGEIVRVTPLFTKLQDGKKTYHVPNTELLTQILEHETG
jgi:small-conductance mechanosensitive channel